MFLSTAVFVPNIHVIIGPNGQVWPCLQRNRAAGGSKGTHGDMSLPRRLRVLQLLFPYILEWSVNRKAGSCREGNTSSSHLLYCISAIYVLLNFVTQIEELTTALVRERQNSAHLQHENARLEQELETKEKALAEARDSRSKAGDDLQRYVRQFSSIVLSNKGL